MFGDSFERNRDRDNLIRDETFETAIIIGPVVFKQNLCWDKGEIMFEGKVS